MFSENVQLSEIENEKIFIDRNPLLFTHVLNYLNSDRKVLP